MRIALAVTVALLGLGPTVARADPQPMSSGASPAPANETQVAMTAETLTIELDLKAATVRAAVTLENGGAATRLTVGFPCATGPDAGQIDVPCNTPVTVTANGKPLRVTRERTGKRQAHWIWTVALAATEKVELVVAYRAPLVNDRYGVPARGMGLFSYRLTTGARWAGPIGALRITLDHMHEPLLFVSPAGYQREAGRVTWTLDDYEPTEEVVIVPEPMAAAQLAQEIGGTSAAELRARIAAGEYEKADVEAALTQLRRQRDDAQGWLKTILPLGGVAVPSKERVDAVVAESATLLERLAAGGRSSPATPSPPGPPKSKP